MDYNHGTGHGVSFLLGVHEGPNAIRPARGFGKDDSFPILPGMITSDEPGLYLEGQYGIRLENLLECKRNENGFLSFESLTLVPFDQDAIEVSLLNDEERRVLNTYHSMIYDKIATYLTQEEREWLKKETQPI